jgi:site-specific recombinase XerD
LQVKTLCYEAIRTKYYHILAFTQFIGANKKTSLITRDDIFSYLNYLELERVYSRGAKAAILTVLRCFFAFFAAGGLIKTNPTANIKIKKEKKIDKTALSEEELTTIFTAAYLKYQPYEGISPTDSRLTLERWLAARDWAIICLLICTGLRRKEIASLKTDSIDFRQRVIKVTGKGDNTYQVRERIIPVTEPITLSAVEIYLSLRPKSIFAHLFLSTHLEPLKTYGFAKVVNNMKQELFPQKSLTITKIRKSFVSLCAEKGIDPLILRQIMGHNSLATTMKYYLTVQEQQLRELWEQNNPLIYFSEKEFEEWTI